MITIVKGKEKIVCTKQTFEEQFRNLGYQIASNDKEATKQVASLSNEENQDKNEEEKITHKYKLDEEIKPKNTKKGK